jgi:hypothetical protein
VTKRLPALLFALLAATAVPSRARAEVTASLSVTTEGCDDLRAPEVERILRIELGQVSEQWSGAEPLRVELACEGAKVHVVAIDPVTDKRLSRDVSLRRTKDRDRTVALLVSQLFLTSWSELLLRPSSDPAMPPPPPAPPPAVARAAEGLVRDATAPSSRRWLVAATLGPRVRDLASPTPSGRLALRPALLFGERWSLALELGYERGTAKRASGSVGYGAVSALAGGALRSAPLGPVVFQVGAFAGAAYVDVRGDGVSSVLGSSASGVVTELELVAGPVLHLGPATLGLELAAGLTAPRATAHVARDADVVLGGPWAGLQLVVGVAEGGP